MPSSGFAGFLLIWGGQFVSQAGTAMTRFALLIWIYEQTGRAASVALLGFFAFVPYVVVSPFAGVWVDRLDRRRVMFWADLGAGCTTAAVLALYATGNLAVWHLYVAEALAAAFEAFQIPAFTAASTLLVPPQHYGRASGLRSVATLGSEGIAPFAAGALIAWIGLPGIMVIDLATVAAALVTLLLVRVPRPPALAETAPRVGFRAEMAGGARFVLDRPGLLGLLAIFAGINLFATLTYFAILPAMVLARSGRDPLALAAVQGANGLAGMVGGIAMSVWGGPRRKIHGVFAVAAASFLAGDLLFALGRNTREWVIGAVVGSVLVPVITGSNQAIWQARVPPAIQGRVFALCGAVRTSTMPIGYLAGGFVADLWLEPAMAPDGWLAPVFQGMVGTGPGAGMAVMFLVTAVLGTLISLSGYLIPAVRRVEDSTDPPR